MFGINARPDEQDGNGDSPRKLGLVLGGGGARGIAHIGVLEVLEEESIPVHLLVGTSMGAFVGGAYAAEPCAKALREKTLLFLESESFRRMGLERFRQTDRYELNFFESIYLNVKRGLAYTHLLRRPSLFRSSILEAVLQEVIPEITFADLKMPFAVSAIDLVQGEEVCLAEGDLRKAILASISLPGFFPPVEMGERLLADMGFLGAVPADVASELGADVVVSVDVSPEFQTGNGQERFGTGLEVLFRVESIGAKALREIRLADSDLIIRPAVGDLYWADFSTAEEMIERGKEAARRMIPEIRKAMAETRKSWWPPFKKSTA